MATKDELMEVQNSALSRIESQKKDIDLQRFKQKCRKIALKMAHEHIIYLPDPNVGQDKDVHVLALADKYYNWLISIPQ